MGGYFSDTDLVTSFLNKGKLIRTHFCEVGTGDYSAVEIIKKEKLSKWKTYEGDSWWFFLLVLWIQEDELVFSSFTFFLSDCTHVDRSLQSLQLSSCFLFCPMQCYPPPHIHNTSQSPLPHQSRSLPHLKEVWRLLVFKAFTHNLYYNDF